jgi:hypothetical protein
LFYRSLDAVCAALLPVFFLPLLAWYSIRAKLDFRGEPAEIAEIGLLKKQIVSEFNFERAIEAYEELIDSTFAKGQL